MLFGRHLCEHILPVRGGSRGFAELFDLTGKFVVEEFEQKYLGDDLIFVAVVAQPIGCAGCLQGVDQRFSLFLKIFHAVFFFSVSLW